MRYLSPARDVHLTLPGLPCPATLLEDSHQGPCLHPCNRLLLHAGPPGCVDFGSGPVSAVPPGLLGRFDSLGSAVPLTACTARQPRLNMQCQTVNMHAMLPQQRAHVAATASRPSMAAAYSVLLLPSRSCFPRQLLGKECNMHHAAPHASRPAACYCACATWAHLGDKLCAHATAFPGAEGVAALLGDPEVGLHPHAPLPPRYEVARPQLRQEHSRVGAIPAPQHHRQVLRWPGHLGCLCGVGILFVDLGLHIPDHNALLPLVGTSP
eukprot:gene7774-biopygen6156